MSWMEPGRRRGWQVLAAVVCCALVPPPTFAQLLEFKGVEVRARLDNPRGDNLWWLGDNNGNGEIDEDEFAGIPSPLGERQVAAMTVVAEPPLIAHLDVWGTPAPNGSYAPDDVVDDLGPGEPSRFGPNDIDAGPVDDFYTSPYGDLDDLVMLPTSWQSIGTLSQYRLRGWHLRRTLVFATPSRAEDRGDAGGRSSSDNPHVDDMLEVGYGLRFFTTENMLNVSAWGGVLGRMQVDTAFRHDAFGPQLDIAWSRSYGRWRFRAGGMAAVAPMDVEGRQFASLGEDIIPGAYNRPLYFPLARSQSSLDVQDIAPIGEANAQLSYSLTRRLVCFARVDGLYYGRLRDAEDGVVFVLPAMGLKNPEDEDLSFAVGMIGIEFRQ